MDVATCINESVYSGSLTRGKRYPILALDEGNGQVRVRGDNGHTRWFPRYCFDLTGGDVISMVSLALSNLTEEPPTGAVDAVVELSDGQRRWCFFITPEMLAGLNQGDFDSGRLVMYGVPHMIVVDAINRNLIEQVLLYIESQNKLPDCTRRVE